MSVCCNDAFCNLIGLQYSCSGYKSQCRLATRPSRNAWVWLRQTIEAHGERSTRFTQAAFVCLGLSKLTQWIPLGELHIVHLWYFMICRIPPPSPPPAGTTFVFVFTTISFCSSFKALSTDTKIGVCYRP